MYLSALKDTVLHQGNNKAIQSSSSRSYWGCLENSTKRESLPLFCFQCNPICQGPQSSKQSSKTD